MKSRNRNYYVAKGVLALPLCLSLALLSCATTIQARKAESSGFLGDYSQLEKGKKDEALLRYVKPGVQWAKYDKILMDPITIWAAPDAGLKGASAEELQALANYLDSTIREHLKGDYQIVDRPGQGVMRLRGAITEGKARWILLDTVSTVVPQARALSTLKKLATGTPAAVGSASIEAEALDSLTNERLAAIVDRRVGGKALRKGFSEWSDVQNDFDYWAERLKTRLSEFRAGTVQ